MFLFVREGGMFELLVLSDEVRGALNLFVIVTCEL